MYRDKKILALITARGGSKGLPGKNIKSLCGKPLIYWTIKEARKSKYIDRIIVSTDDAKIAKISVRYGAEVPFLRPKNLARDESSSIDVAIHAIEWLKKKNIYFDLLLLLQPTSPLRKSIDIDKAIELLISKRAKAIVSVCQVDHPPCWINTLPEDGCMDGFIQPDTINKNRQSLPKYYRLNGAIYLTYGGYLRKRKSFLGAETFAYIMPKERSVDIDSEVDFKLAEILMKGVFR